MKPLGHWIYSFLVLIDTVRLPPKFCISLYFHQQYTTVTLLVVTRIVSFPNHWSNFFDWTLVVIAPKWVHHHQINPFKTRQRQSQPPTQKPAIISQFLHDQVCLSLLLTDFLSLSLRCAQPRAVFPQVEMGHSRVRFPSPGFWFVSLVPHSNIANVLSGLVSSWSQCVFFPPRSSCGTQRL